MECVPLSLMTKLLFVSKQRKQGSNTCIPSPLLRESPSPLPLAAVPAYTGLKWTQYAYAVMRYCDVIWGETADALCS